MGIVIAVVVAVAGAIGASKKAGVFEKGYDTTRVDTIAFERNALEDKLASVQSKQRRVVELSGETAEAQAMQAKLDQRETKLEARIAELKALETQ